MKARLMFGWLVVLLAVFAPSPGLASCAPKFPFCQSRPDRTDQTIAIFVGKVKSVTMPGSALGQEKQYPVAAFEVAENFIGANSKEFTVHITSDVFIGSIPQGTPAFSVGDAWLVEAYYDGHQQQWMTSTCQRTKPVSQASEDLRALRAWVAGDRLPGRVQGQVANPGKGKHLSDVRVYLRGPGGTLPTTTDDSGHFSFDDLEPGVYEAATDGARSMSVDLTHSWCSYVVLFVK